MATEREETGRNVREYFDLTGTVTTAGTETNLFTAETAASGFIDCGEFAGGIALLTYAATTANAGTLKVYAGLSASPSNTEQLGASQTITASGGDQPITILNCPRFLKVTITRTTGNITVAYRLTLRKAGAM
jgi:hypothetical protein